VRQRIVLALTHLLVLITGGAIGFAFGNSYGLANLVPFTDFGAAMYSGIPASGKRLYGTDATYDNALRSYVLLLDDLSTRDASESARKIYAEDKALSLTRLADLAEKRGASDESTRLTSDALAVCSASGLPYCSSAELRQRARKMDTVLESNKQQQ
jgi:hypothetical protein